MLLDKGGRAFWGPSPTPGAVPLGGPSLETHRPGQALPGAESLAGATEHGFVNAVSRGLVGGGRRIRFCLLPVLVH